MNSSSGMASRQLSGQKIAPIFQQQNCTSKKLVLFLASTAIRSPKPTPCTSRRRVANRLQRSFISMYVNRRLVPKSTDANLFGRVRVW